MIFITESLTRTAGAIVSWKSFSYRNSHFFKELIFRFSELLSALERRIINVLFSFRMRCWWSFIRKFRYFKGKGLPSKSILYDWIKIGCTASLRCFPSIPPVYLHKPQPKVAHHWISITFVIFESHWYRFLFLKFTFYLFWCILSSALSLIIDPAWYF